MNNIRKALDDYFELRRALGFELETARRRLRDLPEFMEREGASRLTTELALRWAQRPANGDPAVWAQRLSNLRHFAAWYRARDPRTEVPAQGLLPHRTRRKPPHIYTDEEVERLVGAARALPSPKGLRGHTYSTVIGLLAATGMRISEVAALDRQYVDFDEAIITVRRAKFGSSRIVPIHATTRDALADYARARDGLFPVSTTQAFFLSERGTRITCWGVRDNFVRVSRQLGIRESVEGSRHGHGPRIHDLRHRFAARTLVNWYRAGLDVEHEIPKLSTYLGHVHVNDTYWYIEAVPELLELATERLASAHTEADS